MKGPATAAVTGSSLKHGGRKLYHLLGGLGLASLYFLLGRDRALATYAVLLLIVALFESARFLSSSFNDFLFSRFGSFLRAGEARKITGTGPYVLGVGLAFLFFQSGVAAAAVCFLAVGDVAATTVGERYGRRKISGPKSLEGTLAFAAAAAAAGSALVFAGLPLTFGTVLSGAVTAAAVELLPVPVNDNLLIPLVSGGVMELITHLAG